MAWQNAGLAISEGLAGASGDEATAARAHADMERNRQIRQNELNFQMAPLLQSIAADQQRLSTLAPNSPEHDAVLNNMALTIGKVRNLHGDKTPAEDPSRLATTINGIRQHLHLGGKTDEQLAAEQSGKVNNWYGQNRTMAGEYENAALPFAQTPEGQAEAKKAADALALETRRENSAEAIERMRAQGVVDAANVRATTHAPKGMKAMEQGGVAFGVMDQDTGKQYLPSQLAPNGDAPPEAKQIWQTIQAAQAAKQAEQAKRDAERDKRLANTLGNMGTWTIAEDGQGNTTLYNSKTGEVKEAPTGLHRSGYFAKQIAPLEAASLNIKDYMKNGVFDGPGDLALQHEFFTATQPSTGFRMTKVQQDILHDSRSWLEGWKAKALHAATGQWYTDDQRRRIAEAALEAIEAKKQSLSGAAGGPKTEQLRQKRSGTKPTGAIGIVTYQGKKYWVDKDKNNLGEVTQ